MYDRQFPITSGEDDDLSLFGGDEFDHEEEFDDDDPDNEEFLSQIVVLRGNLMRLVQNCQNTWHR